MDLKMKDMKKMLVMLAVLFAMNNANAQSCLPEGVTFTTQAQVNSFPNIYPECTHIEGDVIINGYNITDLLGLSAVTVIGGDLKIECTQVLPDLTGLNNLTYIGGNLRCVENIALTSLTGLDSVTHIGRDITISNNLVLTSLAGLIGLTSLNGLLWIDDNDALLNLTGLNHVASIAGIVRIYSDESLVSLTGLEGLTTIGGNLVIGGQGHLGGVGNPMLASIAALMNVTSVGGTIEIGYNSSLPSLSGLDNIAAGSIFNLSVYNNDILSECEVASICNYLVSPKGVVNISDNYEGCNSIGEVEQACVAASAESAAAHKAFSVYPNPSSGWITIGLPVTPSHSRFEMLNLHGQILIARELTESTTVIDIHSLSQGIYFFRIIGAATCETGIIIRD